MSVACPTIWRRFIYKGTWHCVSRIISLAICRWNVGISCWNFVFIRMQHPSSVARLLRESSSHAHPIWKVTCETVATTRSSGQWQSDGHTFICWFIVWRGRLNEQYVYTSRDKTHSKRNTIAQVREKQLTRVFYCNIRVRTVPASPPMQFLLFSSWEITALTPTTLLPKFKNFQPIKKRQLIAWYAVPVHIGEIEKSDWRAIFRLQLTTSLCSGGRNLQKLHFD